MRHLLFRQLRQRSSFATAGGRLPSSSSSSSSYGILREHAKQLHGRFVTNNNINRTYASSAVSPAASSPSSSSSSRIHDTMEERRDRRAGPLQQQLVGEQAIELESVFKSSSSSSSSPLQYFPPSSSSLTMINNRTADLSSILSEWFAKIPKGFENFYPKTGGPNNKQDDDDDGNNKDSNDDNQDAADTDSTKGSEKSSSAHHASFKSKNDNNDNKWDSSGGGSGVPPDGGDPPTLTALLAMLLLVMGARRLLEGSENGGGTGGSNGKEITFVEFRNQLLQSGQVDKIVVVNNNMARVVLHPGSKGILSSSSATGLPPSSTGLLGRQSSSSNGGGEADSTVMEFDKPADSAASVSAGGSGGGLTSTLSSSSSLDRNKTPVYHFYIGSIESFEEKLTQAQSHIHPRDWIPVQYVTEVNLLVEFIKATPMLAMLAMLAYWSRGFMGAGGMGGAGGGSGGPGGIFQIGKSNAKKINPESVKVNFGDVAGCDQAKLEIMEFVDFLKDSSRFTKLGAKIPKGALLCGPPGTGKTLLAKAVAGEAGVPFYSISGSDFIGAFFLYACLLGAPFRGLIA